MAYSTTDWALLASPERLAIGGHGGCLVIADPVLRSWELSLDRPVSCMNGIAIAGQRTMELTIRIEGIDFLSTDRLPRGLRFADEMTVRELFSQIDRQLGRRDGKGAKGWAR